jgi:hypothetical protein
LTGSDDTLGCAPAGAGSVVSSSKVTVGEDGAATLGGAAAPGDGSGDAGCEQPPIVTAIATSASGQPVALRLRSTAPRVIGLGAIPFDGGSVFVEKLQAAGCERIILTERGASFGYNNLVVDLRSFPVMRSFGVPVCFDVTHSLQLHGGLGKATGGQSEYIEDFARAGVA